MTIIKGSDGSWTWNGGKEGAQRFDELAQAEALAKFDEGARRAMLATEEPRDQRGYLGRVRGASLREPADAQG